MIELRGMAMAGSVIQRTFGIGLFQRSGRRDKLVHHGQDGKNKFDRSGGAEKMARARLGGRNHETGMSEALPPEHKKRVIEDHVTGQSTRIEDLARVVLELAQNNSVSGQVFNVDSRVI